MLRRDAVGWAFIEVLAGAWAAEAVLVFEQELRRTAPNNFRRPLRRLRQAHSLFPLSSTVFDSPGFRTATLFGVGGSTHAGNCVARHRDRSHFQLEERV